MCLTPVTGIRHSFATQTIVRLKAPCNRSDHFHQPLKFPRINEHYDPSFPGMHNVIKLKR